MKTPTQLMQEALTDYHNGVKDYSNEKILALKLAFENEYERLNDLWDIIENYKCGEHIKFQNNIAGNLDNLKKAIKLAEGIQ